MKHLSFSGEWCIVDKHNEMWPSVRGALEDKLGIHILETVPYISLVYEVCNCLVKKRLHYKQKIRKQLHAKKI